MNTFVCLIFILISFGAAVFTRYMSGRATERRLNQVRINEAILRGPVTPIPPLACAKCQLPYHVSPYPRRCQCGHDTMTALRACHVTFNGTMWSLNADDRIRVP